MARGKKKKTDLKESGKPVVGALPADALEVGEAAVEEEKVLVSTLVIGCRKRVATMTWSGGKPLGGTKVRSSLVPFLFRDGCSSSPSHRT